MSDAIDRIRALDPSRRAALAERLPPLSYAQQQLWLSHQLDPRSTLYTVQYLLRATGDLDPARLERAARIVTERHQVLRTNLVEIDGVARQMIRDGEWLEWTTADLLGRADPLADAREAVAASLARPFDLERDPLVRLALFRLGQADHLLALVGHHVVLDAASVRLMVSEIAAAYAGLAEDAAGGAALPALPLQYADYAVWQRGGEGEAELAVDLDWWRAALADLPEPLDLPAISPREAPGKGARESRDLSPHRLAAIDALGETAGASRFMVLLAAWAELLGRYGNTDDLCIGTPILGRTRAELSKLIGNFVTNVPLRLRLTPGDNVRDRLRRVRETVTGAFAHQGAPLSRIAAAAGMRPEGLFRALINMIVVPPDPKDSDGSAGPTFAALEAFDPPGAMSDVALVIHDLPEGVRLHLDYDTSRLDRAGAARMLDHLDSLISAMAAASDAPIAGFEMLGVDERAAIERFGRGERIPVPPEPVHVLFARQAVRTPDAIAVIDGDRRLTYAALDRRTNALAALLAARGAGPETYIFTLLDETLDVVVAWLAILKAGAAFVPLDHTAPIQRNLALLEQDPGLVLAAAPHAAPLRLAHDRWIDIVDFAHEAATFDGPAIEPEHPIYAMFTSGSTGVPKGVVVTHRGIMNRLAWMEHHFTPGSAAYVLKTTRHLFDSAIWQIFWPLSNGGATVMVDATFPDGIGPVLDLIRAEGVTAVDFVPSAFSALIEALEISGQTCAGLPSLRLAVFGGEQVTRDGVDWIHRHSDAAVYNLYGPTEASIGCIYRPLERDYGGFIPIGLPIANTDVLLLGANGEALPVGVPGEICLVGACLARGYLDQPSTTAASFTPAIGGERLYRTGDLGRWLPQGALEYLGRIDHQVKIRGHRVELGEIETHLKGHPAIARAVVVPDVEGGRTVRLLGYVVGKPQAEIQGQDLRAFLRERLPEHMTPAHIMVLPALPTMPNGKLDRRSLPRPVSDEMLVGSAPRPGAEAILARVVADVLGLAAVAREANYFDLGGDSIHAIRIAARARREGLELSAAQIFAAQSVAAMAALAGKAEDFDDDTDGNAGAFPLTPIQARLVESAKDIDRVCHTAILELDVPASGATVDAALAALVQHHPALRLRLAQDSKGDWSQHYAQGAAGAPPCEVLNLAACASDEREAQMRDVVEAMRATLEVRRGPLLRATRFDMGERGQMLALVVHHIAVDAVSWSILLEDLRTSLAAARREEVPSLPQTTRSYRAWAEALQHAALDSEAIAASAWWTDSDWTAAWRPSRAHAAQDGFRRTASIVLSRDTTAILEARSWLGFEAQLGEVLLGCLVHALALATGCSAQSVALEGHGRDALPGVAVERTVGWFTLAYPALFEAASRDVAATVKQTVAQLRGISGKGAPYALGRYLRGDPALAAIPECPVSFNYVGDLDPESADAQGVRLAPFGSGWRDASAGQDDTGRVLDVNVSIFDGELGLHLVWRSQSAERWTHDFEAALRAAVEDVAEALRSANVPSGFDLLDVE